MGAGREVAIEVAGSLIGAVLLSVGALVAGPVIADHISDQLSGLYPTCDKAIGLRPLVPADLEGWGPERSRNYPPTNAVDGYSGSVWVPPLASTGSSSANGFSPYVPVFSNQEDQSTLTLTLKKARNIRLVCVNNGFGAGDTRYENFGKVRTVATWGAKSDSDNRVTTILSSFPVEQSETLQKVHGSMGAVSVVHIRLIDAYAGKDVMTYDPDQCAATSAKHPQRSYRVVHGVQQLDEAGCILSASPKAGLSEVALYTSYGT